MAKGKLSEKERAFIDTYLTNGFRKKDAYLAIWNCAESTARTQAYYTFNRPEVQEYLNERKADIYKGITVDAEMVLNKLAAIAFAEKGDSQYTTKDQLKALDLLQKQLGLQKAKLEAEVNTDIVVNIEE